MLPDSRTIRRFCCICGFLLFTSACTYPRVANWNPDDYTVRSGDTIYSIAWKFELDPFEMARWNNIPSPYVIHAGQRLHTRDMGGAKVAVTEPRSSPAVSTATKRQPKSKPHHAPAPAPATSNITVRKGDTLYGLARRHGVSAARLAQINALKSPYLLTPGQTLSLKPKPKSGSKTKPGSHGTGTTARVAAAPTSRYKPKPKPQTESKTKPASGSSQTADAVSGNTRIRWAWPVNGAIVNRFDHTRSDSKGIDIAGREGSPVRAAAPGKVVYSGNGLISYGNLVIIKHNHNYLSAYAYNRKLLVSEGDTVKAGQKIAEVGRTGSESPRLHFEIRKNGKPVNPLAYLPSS